MTGWDRLLAPFKAAENKEVAALVLADSGLQKLLAAWPLAKVNCTSSPEEMVGLDWTALWDKVQIDETHLEALTGMQALKLRKLLQRAIALRLIYPDGSLHDMALMVVRKKVHDALA